MTGNNRFRPEANPFVSLKLPVAMSRQPPVNVEDSQTKVSWFISPYQERKQLGHAISLLINTA